MLVVDDDPDFRCLLRDVLEDQHCFVVEAGDGRLALEILRGVRPNLVLIDVCMPFMDGLQLRAALDQDRELSSIPVVLLSGYAIAPPAGMTVLRKPIDLSALVRILDVVEQARTGEGAAVSSSRPPTADGARPRASAADFIRRP